MSNASDRTEPLSWRAEQFPIQEKPLYMILIQKGQFHVTTCHRYQILTINRKVIYRIRLDHAITSKTEDQLDRLLNGRVWTFNPDLQNIAKLYHNQIHDLEQKADACLKSAGLLREALSSAECHLASRMKSEPDATGNT